MSEKEEKMQIKIEKWPWGAQAPFCINFDDLSPMNVLHYDFGATPSKGINLIQQQLLVETPIKITHFVVPKMNWWMPVRYLDRIANIRTSAFALDNPKNAYWVSWLKELIDSKRVEVAWHGYTHFNKNMFRKKFMEFLHTSFAENKLVLEKAHSIFEKAGIVVKGFRPPGWGYKEDGNLFAALKDQQFVEYIAASSFDAGLNGKSDLVNNWEIQLFQGLLNVPQNIEIADITKYTKSVVLTALDNTSILTPKGHYCNVGWIPNALTPENTQKLNDLIAYVRDKPVWYATLHESVQYYKNIRTMERIRISEGEYTVFIFRFLHGCAGFTVSMKHAVEKKIHTFTVDDTFSFQVDMQCSCKIIFSANVHEYRIILPGQMADMVTLCD